jgi:hypothetical protein
VHYSRDNDQTSLGVSQRMLAARYGHSVLLLLHVPINDMIFAANENP